MTKKQIKKYIKLSLLEFIQKDKDDLMNVNIYEPTLNHRIAVYLERYFCKFGYVVDCEYNKNRGNPKEDDMGHKIRPDIIIHKRNNNNNIAIFEIKKAGEDSLKGKADIEKLKRCRNLNYGVGVFVGILKRKIDIVWIGRGNDLTSEII